MSKSLSTPCSATAKRPRPSPRGIAAAAALFCALGLGHGLSAAQSVNVAVTGVGEVCMLSNTDPGVCTGGLVLNGNIRFDVIGTASDISTYEASGSQWVQTSFDLHWTGASSGSFVSIEGPTAENSHFTMVYDGYPYFTDHGPSDMLYTGTAQAVQLGNNPPRGMYASGYVDRRTLDRDDWLTGLGFDTSLGLAPGVGAQNTVSLYWAIYELVGDQAVMLPGAYSATFQLNSWNVSAVPELGTGVLLMLGALPLLPAMRRRLNGAE